MNWQTFSTPDDNDVPVNLARVTYIQRVRSPNDQTQFSGRARLYFAKDFYLEILLTDSARQKLTDACFAV